MTIYIIKRESFKDMTMLSSNIIQKAFSDKVEAYDEALRLITEEKDQYVALPINNEPYIRKIKVDIWKGHEYSIYQLFTVDCEIVYRVVEVELS